MHWVRTIMPCSCCMLWEWVQGVVASCACCAMVDAASCCSGCARGTFGFSAADADEDGAGAAGAGAGAGAGGVGTGAGEAV